MKPDEKGGCTADVHDFVRGLGQTENGVRLQQTLRARHAHKTDPVLSTAMFTIFAKAACTCDHHGNHS
jgi:hypothetical protein